MKRYYILIIALVLSADAFTQNQEQAFRYSQSYPVGTARFAAMGGAMGAIGGDFSAASVNPAGLGLYRSSEFTITPSFYINSAGSNFLGNQTRESEYNFNIGSLGIVTSFDRQKKEGIVGTTFAFGYNALNNFNSTTMMRGTSETSLLDNFTWYANNSNERDIFYEDLAFETALMPFDSTTNNYWHYLQPYGVFEGYEQDQVRIVEKRGYLGEYTFSYALNISHKVYLGGTVGIHSVRFYEDIYHTETDISDLEPDFESFRFGEYNTTRGTGYAFKIGVIIKPIHILRIGASFHAPVVYNLTDEKFTDLNAYWNSNAGITDGYASSGLHAKDYVLRTPYRATASAALLLGKLGMVSAEYEYVDYSSADLDSPGYKFVDENFAIAQDFKNTHNLKAGAELRLNPLYLRGGAQYYMNPFTDERNGSDIWVYSGGIGIRSNQSFVDISYSLRYSEELYSLYQYAPDQAEGFEKSINEYTAGNFMVTLGFKF